METAYMDPISGSLSIFIQTLEKLTQNKNFYIYLIIFLIIWLAIIIVKAVFKTIKWIIKTIFSVFTGNTNNFDPLQSDDWLTRAQAKQEIRFKNSLPPLLPKQQPKKKKKRLFKRKGEGETWYPSGWTLNEETGLWEPPDYMK